MTRAVGRPALRVLGPGEAERQALLDEWVLRQRAGGLSAKTIRERLAVVSRLSDPVHLSPVDVDRFLANPAWSKSTRATYHGAIRAWCLWLVRTGRRPDDPTLIATTPKVPKGRPRPVADEHLTVLLSTRMSGRTRAMILLGAYAGLRVSEIAAIRGEHVDLITCTIAITGKGEKTRYIPLHPILQLLARGMPAREWWFPSWVGNCQHAAGGPVLGNSVSARVSKAMDRAGVPGKPHSLRHWFGSTLKESGVDSLVIKELMGHESLATTAIYVRVPLRMQCSAVNLLPDVRQLATPGRFAALPKNVGATSMGPPRYVTAI